MGKLYVVGFGPGGYEHMTQKAIDVISNADVVTGYITYVNILKEFFPDQNHLATPMMQDEMNADIEIETVPGVTAASAAASVLGAPLMHDFAVISLSDLMTPFDLIMKRVDCAGQGDMIVCLYNPKSKKRVDYVEKAADILMKYRGPETPVGIVRNAGRKDESSCITTLGELKNADIDMFSVVIVGNSQTYTKNGRMITPRGYRV